MKQESTVDLLLDVDQRPSAGKGILLSFQHVFAMFGATILVPLILGMPVSVALFASGIGTLIYMISTGFKVPVYLGSSFAFITAMSLAMKEMGGRRICRSNWSYPDWFGLCPCSSKCSFCRYEMD